MQETLKQTLKEYFYDGSYGELPQSEEVKKENQSIDTYIRGLGLEDESLFELDEKITTSENAYELQGFLRGYEYCLIMLNLSGGGTVNG